jgi:iron complex transport system permease protein
MTAPFPSSPPPPFSPPSLAASGARRRAGAVLALSLAALAAALALGVGAGTVSIPPLAVLHLLTSRLPFVADLLPPPDYPERFAQIIFELRLPRAALMAVTGGALASAGATYQGLFRNPLADPYIIGVASGAGLGATLVLALEPPAGFLGNLAVPAGAFAGGALAIILVLAIAQVGRTMPVTTMLLAGVAVSAFATAASTFLMFRSPAGLQRAFHWLFGGLTGGGWTAVLIALPCFLLGLAVIQLHARALNVLQLDDEQAAQLGIAVERVKVTLLGAATLMTAAAVAFGGLLGFVGLVVPHVLRILGGPDYRRLILHSAIGGAAFLILADVLARTLFSAEAEDLPVGVVTALVGAPFFIALLRQIKRSVF